jgi:hypothetical protein
MDSAPQAGSRAGYRRSRRLVLAGLQLKLAGSFALLACLATVVQAFVMVHLLSSLASRIEGSAGPTVLAQATSLVVQNVLIALALLVPPFLMAGILITFRIAGPIYRFKRYFEDLAERGYKGPCTLRKEDELKDLCQAINRGVERLVEDQGSPARGAVRAFDVDQVPAALPAPDSKARVG